MRPFRADSDLLLVGGVRDKLRIRPAPHLPTGGYFSNDNPLTAQPWFSIGQTIAAVCKLRLHKIERVGEHEDLFLETLSKVWPRVAEYERTPLRCAADRPEALRVLCGYAKTIAVRVWCDHRDAKREERSHVSEALARHWGTRDRYGSRVGSGGDVATLRPHDAGADGLADYLDDPATLLTAPFDREEFWRRCHDWCRARARHLADELGPHVVALANIIAKEACSAELTLTVASTPKEIYEREYERVRKAARRSRKDVPAV